MAAITLADKARRAARRIHLAVRPRVTITDPPTSGLVIERDVEVPVRDGTLLRVDVFRPDDDGQHPVLLCAHPYGKDAAPSRRGGRWQVPFQFRLLSQTDPFSVSALATWEAPDPAFWVPRGYAVVNADLRGWGRSDGVGELLSDQEADDVHDLIEWAGVAPWSTGRVGMTGVSYLAITQWAAASTRPSHLAAINPWEGFTDLYRDFARPGGVREDGFLRVWAAALKRVHRSPVDLREEVAGRPLRDDWYRDRTRDLERIEVPALVCASFSDHCLHSRGSFEGYRRIASNRTYLYTHRGPKWAAYYGADGRAAQARFFDQYLRGDDTGIEDDPPVRVEVRSDARTVVAVHHTTEWPPPDRTWTTLALDAATAADGVEERRGPGALVTDGPEGRGSSRFEHRAEAVFVHRFTEATDVIGPMWAHLAVSLEDGEDPTCFVGVRKVRDGRVVGFEGSYGFAQDLVTHGMVRVAVADGGRAPADRVPPWDPGHRFEAWAPVERGVQVPLDIELHASATRFDAGDELHLVLRTSWFFPTNPLTGQFPVRYRTGARTRCLVYTGPGTDSALHLLTGPPLP